MPTEIDSRGFSAFDWNFDAVSGSELVACCYWEYARESFGIRELQRRGFQPDFWEETDSEQSRIGHGIYAVGFSRCAVFREGFFSKRLFPQPWQALSAAERKSMVSGRLVGKSPAFRRSTPDATLQLVRYYDQKLKRHVTQPSATFVSDYGLEVTTVEIDWRANSNEEIVQAFRKWVTANRPERIPKPHRRGRDKNVSYRVDLERLGILRLLNRWRLSELRVKCPEAWERYNTANRRWRSDAETARARFHSLFPFLAEGEEPISWPAKR